MNEELKSIDSEKQPETTKNPKKEIIKELPSWNIEPPITIKRGNE